MSMKNPTSAQLAVLEFVARFTTANSYPPTTREIAEHFEFRSQSAAVHHLDALRRKGRLTWEDRKARTLRIIAA